MAKPGPQTFVMSRTSAALVQDLLSGLDTTLLSPIELSQDSTQPMHLFMCQKGPGEITGILTNHTSLEARIKQVAHPHSWVIVTHDRGSISFMCECSAYISAVFTVPVVPLGSLVPDRYQAAHTLKKYLQNALNLDPRSVKITDATQSRLKLDVLGLFGWTSDEKQWSPPRDPDAALYARAIRELDFIIANEAGQVIDQTSELYALFEAPYVPYTKTPAQKLLGCASGDSDQAVYDQYIHQTELDPSNVPYYLDALRDLSMQSEFLQMRFMEQESLGVVSLTQIRSAYQEFNFSLGDNIEDEAIISIFSSDPKRLAPALAVIADHRQSHRLRRLSAAISMTYHDAMRVLGIDESSQEALVASRANTLISSPDTVVRYEGKYALLQVGSNRKSSPLLALYENLYPPEPINTDPYIYFGIAPTLDNENITAAFELICQDEPPHRQIELRSYLRAIANARQSTSLYNYLEHGLLVQDVETSLYPVGLWNIGNTCYLNSLLQFYNTLVPFREALKELEAQENDDTMSKKKVGGRLVPYAEVSRSQKFLRALNALYTEMESTMDRYVTPTEELAYMALVPPREDIEEEVAKQTVSSDISLNNTGGQREETGIAGSLEEKDPSLIECMPELDDRPNPLPEAVPVPVCETKEAEYKQKLHQALERQQDVTECIENVLYQVEAGVRAKGYDEDGEQQDLIKDLFYGVIEQTLQNLGKDSDKRVKNERVSSIMVNVIDQVQDIYSALDGYFAAEKIELSEGVFERTVALSKMPPILQIQVQRVQFDRTTYQLFKNNNPITLDETLYMDRYVKTDDPAIIQKRTERIQLQERKRELDTELKSINASQANNCTQEENLSKAIDWMEAYIEDHPTSDDLPVIQQALGEARKVLVTVREKRKTLEEEFTQVIGVLDTQFDDYRKYGYRIHSLFIHRGQASHGHYWIYIKDFEQNHFLKYNDETVTIVSDADVFDYSPGNTATPYFIVYIREDFVDQVKSVNRSVEVADGQSQATSIPVLTTDTAAGENPFLDGTTIDNPIRLDSGSPPVTGE